VVERHAEFRPVHALARGVGLARSHPVPAVPNEPTFNMPASVHPTPQIVSKMDECQRLVPHNYVAGHIDNTSWQDVSREMAGQ